LHINDHKIRKDVRTLDIHQEALNYPLWMWGRLVSELDCRQGWKERRISQLFKYGIRHEINTYTKVTKSILDLLLVDCACDRWVSRVFSYSRQLFTL
jgi:hypothetical protein